MGCKYFRNLNCFAYLYKFHSKEHNFDPINTVGSFMADFLLTNFLHIFHVVFILKVLLVLTLLPPTFALISF